MTESGISDSRFFMWRAIVAMAHADKIIEPEEREMVENYLDKVPFSKKQREVLLADLQKQKDVALMFEMVTDPEDRSAFFQFARMMVWSDGDLDAQEKKILDHLEKSQMNSLNSDWLEEMVRLSRQDSRFSRLKEDEAFERDARNKLSMGAMLGKFLNA